MNELREHAPAALLVVAGLLISSAAFLASADTKPIALVLGFVCTGAGLFVYARADQVAEWTDAADGGTHSAWVGHIFIIAGAVFAIINIYGMITATRERPVEGLLVAAAFALIGLAMVLMRRDGAPPTM